MNVSPTQPQWSESYCGVSQLIIGWLQHTLTDYGRFAELSTYSWAAHGLTQQQWFFREPWQEGCSKDTHNHWGYGDDYIEAAKRWVAEGRFV